MGLALGTVRKYARAESFPARMAHGPGSSILDPHLPYLGARVAEDCENAMALWREFRERGFLGGSRQVHRWLAERRAAPAKTGRRARRIRGPGDAPPSAARRRVPALLTAPQLAWTRRMWLG